MHESAFCYAFFAIFNVFHNRQSTRNTFPHMTTSLSCTRSPSTLPMFTPTVPFGQFWKRFFLSVNRQISVYNTK